MDQIVALLTALGNTPEEVAANLQDDGIRGFRSERSFHNPIIRYLNRHLDIGGLLEIVPETGVLRIVREGKVRETPLPTGTASFLKQFHQGLHPNLEEENHKTKDWRS